MSLLEAVAVRSFVLLRQSHRSQTAPDPERLQMGLTAHQEFELSAFLNSR
jgi:hypothetical protein